MMDATVEKAFNEQMNKEFYSNYIYLAMSAWAESQNLRGVATWFRTRANEELVHANKFYDYLNSRLARVRLQAIAAPPVDWPNALAVFSQAFEHECFISKSINETLTVAKQKNDHAAEVFLQWFVNEQVEEEEVADLAAAQLKMIGDNGMGLYLFDREIGARANNPTGATAPAAGPA